MRQHESDYLSLAAGLLFTVLGVLFAAGYPACRNILPALGCQVVALSCGPRTR